MNIFQRVETVPNYADLVEEGRVHSSIYTDPAIFEAEMERIFHRTWLCIGHASEIPNPGDYRVVLMGRQSAIMVRGHDKVVRVLMNRCRHRGSTVTSDEQGCARRFTCPYHGWTFDNTGDLVAVPEAGAYDNLNFAEYGLTPAPRQGIYRGFVFASLAPSGPTLDQHLGLAKRYIDIFVDASPKGEIEARSGSNKAFFRGNWKFFGMDGYHPTVLHKTFFDMSSRNRPDGLPAIFGRAYHDESGNLTRDVLNGHVLLDVSPVRRNNYEAYLKTRRGTPGFEEYYAALINAYGQEKADEMIIWGGDPHVGIYPNLQLIGAQITIVRPIAVDHTETLIFPTTLADVPEPINQQRLRAHEAFYGPAGHGVPDDAEASERTQRGLMATVDPWILLSRGLHRQKIEPDGSIVGAITDEVTQRGQLNEWKKCMSGAI
jgi:phenylpropionate dioxygenase-like ring-hydroxylating dioxygenase large terminal subunit